MPDRATKRRVTQAHLDAIEQDGGPIYGVRLLDSLPLDGGMRQALPSRDDLVRVREISERTVAGFEVLTEHYRRSLDEIKALQDKLIEMGNHVRQVEQDAHNLADELAGEQEDAREREFNAKEAGFEAGKRGGWYE